MLKISHPTYFISTCILAPLILSSCATTLHPTVASDPFLWLEEIQDPKSLEWVKKNNEQTLKVLKGITKADQEQYQQIEKQVREISSAQDRIPMPKRVLGKIYNFWQSKQNPAGIWRRATERSYRTQNPKWEILLDVDALNRLEGKKWSYKDIDCLMPAMEKCLVFLSPDGGDAVVVREFSLKTKQFIPDGFQLPEAKQNVAWWDENTLLVATDFGPGSLSQSGYPLVLKRWKRGQALKDATLVYQAPADHMSVHPWVVHRENKTIAMVSDSPKFFQQQTYVIDSSLALQKLDLPVDANVNGVHLDQVLFTLRSDLIVQSTTGADRFYKKGSLLSLPMDSGKALADSELVFEPIPTTVLVSVGFKKSSAVLTVLSNVRSKMIEATRVNSSWNLKAIHLPENGMISRQSTSSWDDHLWVNFSDFLTPSSVMEVLKSDQQKYSAKTIKKSPSRFQAKGMRIEQNFATSRDGTLVPYFVVYPKNFKGHAPTLLYGYGGFENAMTPYYSGVIGKVWLERGGVYVLANIRGGGEFGPAWHQAAILEKKQNSYDDFIAIAEDLIAKKITTPKQLGIMGGSNGGLLMGVMATQRPDLFGAIVCQVPLLDMLRYHYLLAGSSWIAEYGNPEVTPDRAYIEKYSPYQNLHSNLKIPSMYVFTSTADNRVHPGHARKFVAKMQSLGMQPDYFERIEGGHGGSSNLDHSIENWALAYRFLWSKLGGR